MLKIGLSKSPNPELPYSQGIALPNGFIFVSGQIAVDPATHQIIEGGIEAQTARVIDNVEAVLKAAGATLADVVRTELFLTDLAAHFQIVNALYVARMTGAVLPVRQTVGVSALPKGALVEISCIAWRQG